MNTRFDPLHTYDLFVIGGGINGCGIANDASGRGLSVFLCEQFDLANETSSRSSKMIHGGLRYLEYYEFRLVREALEERDVSLNIAPHIVQPLQLIIPHNNLQRPAWIIRLGLFIYDYLGIRFGKRSKIPSSYSVSFKTLTPYSIPLKPELQRGFCYYDCKVDDARLVTLNAMAARDRGATIATRTKLISAHSQDDRWYCIVEDQHTQERFTLHTKAIINAAGPWVDEVIQQRLPVLYPAEHHIELVKGSHIVIPRFYEGEHAYLLQHDDKRVIFVIPFHQDFTLIGTTDLAYQGDPATVSIDAAERDYLCDIVNHYFKKTIVPSDIVYEWSGVRPLQADEKDNPSAVTRDYFLELKTVADHPPVLSIFGGKITTYRELATHALEKLKPYFPKMGKPWTQKTPLPGGNINSAVAYSKTLSVRFPLLPTTMLDRYAHSYGDLSELILKNITSIEDLGIHFGADLYAKEVDYLIEQEWAQTVEDILWRRSKLGLRPIFIEKLQKYLIVS